MRTLGTCKKKNNTTTSLGSLVTTCKWIQLIATFHPTRNQLADAKAACSHSGSAAQETSCKFSRRTHQNKLSQVLAAVESILASKLAGNL